MDSSTEIDSKRDEAIAKSMRLFKRHLPDEWDGKGSEFLGRAFRYFAEGVIGASLERLLPHMKKLREAAVAGLTDPSSVRAASKPDGWEGLHVADGQGGWFGVQWITRASKYASKNPSTGDDEDASKDITDIEIMRLDPSRLDYPYPDQIASAVLVEMDPGRLHSTGYTTKERFGISLDALDVIASAVRIDRTPIDPKVLHGERLSSYSDHNDALALDGGIAGGTCREIGARMSAAVADRIMRWADRVFPDIAGGLEAKGAVWGKKCLQFNDLDNTVSLMEPSGDGAVAVIHSNCSLISDYKTYVLRRSAGDALALYAIEDGTDDFRRLLAALKGDGEFTPVAVLANGKTVLQQPFDTTDVIGFMGFGLNCVKEIVLDGNMRDSEFVEDFSSFDARDEEDVEEEDDAPRP